MRASATAAKLTDTAPEPRPVSVRTRLPTANDAVEQPVEHRARRRARRVGDGVRVLHLAENLRLADDQRVEAGGDAEQMARDVEIGDVVDVRLQRLRDRRRGTR